MGYQTLSPIVPLATYMLQIRQCNLLFVMKPHLRISLVPAQAVIGSAQTPRTVPLRVELWYLHDASVVHFVLIHYAAVCYGTPYLLPTAKRDGHMGSPPRAGCTGMRSCFSALLRFKPSTSSLASSIGPEASAPSKANLAIASSRLQHIVSGKYSQHIYTKVAT
ncbi:hypothetical protein CHU98_g2131 [Xylaria longipes]|nr:hypothetical protein CHU98_g2131 [Xylaria longipes]